MPTPEEELTRLLANTYYKGAAVTRPDLDPEPASWHGDDSRSDGDDEAAINKLFAYPGQPQDDRFRTDADDIAEINALFASPGQAQTRDEGYRSDADDIAAINKIFQSRGGY